jgi:hypothetical protein
MRFLANSLRLMKNLTKPPNREAVSSDVHLKIPVLSARSPHATNDLSSRSSSGSREKTANACRHPVRPRPVIASGVRASDPNPILPWPPLARQSGSVYAKWSPASISGPVQGNLLGISALVVGLGAISLYWLAWVNLVCPALSVILGGIDLWQTRAGTGVPRLPGVAGLALGGVLLPVGLFVINVALSLTSVWD